MGRTAQDTEQTRVPNSRRACSPRTLILQAFALVWPGRVALDNSFVEQFWRSLKCEEVYIRDYATVPESEQGLERYFTLHNHEGPYQSLDCQVPATTHFQPIATEK